MVSSDHQGDSINFRRKPRIFISYKRGVVPDEAIALEIFQELRETCDVFIDQTMLVGTSWAERIEAEIRQSDFVITLLSSYSVSSEMVKGEIEIAYHLAKQQGHPVILPVRLAYHEPFQYPLSAYLNGINWAIWKEPQDTTRLVKELQQAILGINFPIDLKQGKPELAQQSQSTVIPQPLPFAQPTQYKLSQVAALETPGGTMSPDSSFYVERSSDALALHTIGQQGVTITIKGPRQVGKSSLLTRMINTAMKVGKRVVFLDFQLFDKASLTNSDLFFQQFCVWLTDELEMSNRLEEYWNTPLGNNQRTTRYMQRYLLKELGFPLVLAMDEVECVFESVFRSDFFSMLRSWHNNRATSPAWRQLDLALVTSTEPYQLIENLNQSPFNVGQIIELADFTLEQVIDLNQRHGSSLTLNQLQQLMELVSGHPYLIRRALYLVTSQQISVDQLFAKAIDDRGPFGDHLRYHLFRIHDKKELVQGLLSVLQNNLCQDERIFFRLRGAGLVRRSGQNVVPYCQLYTNYFRERLYG